MMRPSRLGPIGLRLPVALALLFATATPALAQSGGLSNFTQNPEADQRRDSRKPTGLPGARSTRGVVTPAERMPADMSPNEGLFDAVNRGDIAAARDAIGRGAQLDGRNILGLTPLELSIDLGRNELTFLLLSMRGAVSAPPPPPPSAAARPTAPRPTDQRPAVPRTAAQEAAPPRQRQTTAAAAGTPVPQAGFLGFGGPVR